MRQGNKKIYHLEAWVVKVMSLYKVRSHMIWGIEANYVFIAIALLF
jgi:hypothetical protein